MKALSLLALICAWSLCSCYTNFNQTFMRKEYDGYLIEIPRKAPDDTPAGQAQEKRQVSTEGLIPEEKALPSVLYRCGEDWYVAGVRCDVRARDRHFHSIFEAPTSGVSFKMTPMPGCPVYYHKITNYSAQRVFYTDPIGAPKEIVDLLKLQSVSLSDARARRIDKKVMRLWTRWMEKNGIELDPDCEWVSELPKGAVAVHVPLLEVYGYSKKDAKLISVSGGTHNHIFSGLTTVVWDVPGTIVANVLMLATAFVYVAPSVPWYSLKK